MNTEKIRHILKVLFLLTAGIALFVFWDHQRVGRDFINLMKVLRETRSAAIYGPHPFTVKFAGKEVVVTELDSGKERFRFTVGTIQEVNYDTTLGKGMIVFTSSGTDPFNIQVHGGDIRLRSWFGFERSIWVNCTGFVQEGVLVDRELKVR